MRKTSLLIFHKKFYYKFIKQKNKFFYILHFYIIYNIFIEKDWLEKNKYYWDFFIYFNFYTIFIGK